MYRERERIGATLADALRTLQAWGLAAEVLLIDDGSDDDTAGVAREAIARAGGDDARVHVRVITHDANRGKGAAVLTGLRAARGDWRLMMDADNATRLDQLPRLVDRVRASGADMGVGSRVAPGADARTSRVRRLIGRGFQVALRTLGIRLARDTQCGFKLYSRRAADVVLEHAREPRFAFDVEHLLLISRAGLKVEEVGVVWDHQSGSTVRPVRDGLNMLRRAYELRRAIARLDVRPGGQRPGDLPALGESSGWRVVTRPIAAGKAQSNQSMAGARN